MTLRRKVLGKRRWERERDAERRQSDSPGESRRKRGCWRGVRAQHEEFKMEGVLACLQAVRVMLYR